MRITHHASRVSGLLALVCSALLLAGCALSGHRPQARAAPSPPPSWPATAEPEPSATPGANGAPGATQSPEPSPTSTPLPVQADDLNLLLLGSDRREGSTPGWNTDTLIVVAVRPRDGIVAMLSIPRDLWVNIPGHGYGRINTADYLGEEAGGPGGGPALVGETLKENLGISIDAYARIDFQGLARIIDAVGGITVTSDRALDEWFWDETSPSGASHMVVVEGPQHMDGKLALMYARARHDSNDLDRSRRQQQILLALRDAALRPEVLPRLPGLIRALSDAVDTDLRPGQVLSLTGLALRLRGDAYRSRVFDTTMVRDWTTPGGAMVLLGDRARIEAAWAELTAPAP